MGIFQKLTSRLFDASALVIFLTFLRKIRLTKPEGRSFINLFGAPAKNCCLAVSFVTRNFSNPSFLPMRCLFFVLLIVITPVFLVAQFFEPIDYPKGYFRNPLDIPIDLSGNFGELRPNHYHMGLDLKTNKRINLPVYAAAEGYISRIKIEPGGFGRAIYINHPNGFTTLYAHLNDFEPGLERWVKDQQYRQERWNVFIE